MTYHSHLYYGGPGSGKTYMLVSSFWNVDTHKQLRNGRLLLFGRETNEALLEEIPDKLIKRFVSPVEEPLQFVDDFELYMRAVVAEARKGTGPEVLAIDGYSEWNAVFMLEHQARYGVGDKWAGWRAAKDKFIASVQMLNPTTLKAHVLGTARVTERKKGVVNKQGDVVVEADPDWMDFKYYPAMEGWAKENLPHYFGLVSYVDADPGPVTDLEGKVRQGTHHKYYMVPSETGFWVKNWWEREWFIANMPPLLTNPKFDDILGALESAKTKTAALREARSAK